LSEERDHAEHSTVPGARKQGRPKDTMDRRHRKWAKMSFEKLLRETEDTLRWGSRLVHEASNPRNEDG